jgi:hypothetical protein
VTGELRLLADRDQTADRKKGGKHDKTQGGRPVALVPRANRLERSHILSPGRYSKARTLDRWLDL